LSFHGLKIPNAKVPNDKEIPNDKSQSSKNVLRADSAPLPFGIWPFGALGIFMKELPIFVIWPFGVWNFS
jgi:hypothetical protein